MGRNNVEIARGLRKFGKRKGRHAWAIKKKNGGKFPVTKPQPKPANPKQYGKPGVFYPAEDVERPLKRNKKRHFSGTHKLRASIKPGQIVILLAGKFKGKHAVFLK